MKTSTLFLLSLPGLAALSAVLPHARAVTAARARLAAAATLRGTPCTPSAPAQTPVSAAVAERFTKGPLSFSLEMDSITSSCWMSQDDMISWNGNRLVVFNGVTQQATPIPGTETVFSGKHWASIASLSPDSHWLVWAGGEDGHSTWDAVSTDGTEHRQWPRDESISTPAVAWMQDNKHWVELRTPETKVSAGKWRSQPDNRRVKIYDLDTPDVQEFPLRLETPDPAFLLLCNCGKTSEFIFTKDGRAWLSENWQTAPTVQGDGRCSREDVYELLPGPDAWTLRKSFIYPVADPERWTFDSPARSPDGQWIAWRNYAPTGKDKLRLMLSRTDGSEMRVLYQSDTSSGVEPEWSPDSRQIAFTDNGPLGIVTVKVDDLIARAPTCSPDRTAARVNSPGRFPVARLQARLMGKRGTPSGPLFKAAAPGG